MDERVRRSILEKNQKLIDMVIERVKRDFAGDIALIGLTGSFQTGDFHEASDLDLIIISENDRPAAMSRSFILGDVGYDIYLTPWSPRIEQAAALESPMVSALVDLQILYSAGPEATAKFEGYRRRALAALAQPIGPACLGRARTWIDRMMRDYAAACVGEDIGAVRYAAGGVLYNAVNALTQLNNTYIRCGVGGYRALVAGYEHLPEHFLADYDAIAGAQSAQALRDAALRLLKGVEALWRAMDAQYGDRIVPTAHNLAGTYEELWCNYRNKVRRAARLGDASYLFLAAVGAQNYLDEMHGAVCGVPSFDLMRHFDARNPAAFEAAFEAAMARYRAQYDEVGLAIERYDDFGALYASYMAAK